jgi:hypothetical protein
MKYFSSKLKTSEHRNVIKNINFQFYSLFVAVFFLISFSFFQVSLNIPFIDGFTSRLFEDTRTSQYVSNLNFVVKSLPFGIGYPSIYVLNNYDIYGIDNGYLMILLYFGLPMLFLFIIFTIFPIIRSSFSKKINLNSIIFISIGLMRILWLFSSYRPDFSFETLFLLLSCIYFYSNRKMYG